MLSTLLGLVLVTVVAVGVRLLVMQRLQQRRERHGGWAAEAWPLAAYWAWVLRAGRRYAWAVSYAGHRWYGSM